MQYGGPLKMFGMFFFRFETCSANSTPSCCDEMLNVACVVIGWCVPVMLSCSCS